MAAQRTLTQDFLPQLFDLIDSQIAEQGEWKIELSEICSLADIRLEDAYRSMYNEKQLISGYIPDSFDADNVRDLISLLSSASQYETESAFENAGVWLGVDDLSELAAVYYDTATRRVDAHEPDADTFSQMLRRFKTNARAFEVYREYFFDADDFYEGTVRRFSETHTSAYPRILEFTARRNLDMLLSRHIIDPAGLFEVLYGHLTGADQKRGFEPEGDPEIRRALGVLGLKSLPRTQKELRDHYKILMKTYHPDVNPEGLEMSKRINAAYSELMAYAS